MSILVTVDRSNGPQHPTEPERMRALVTAIGTALKPSAFVARIAADTFAVVVPLVTAAEANDIARRIHAAVVRSAPAAANVDIRIASLSADHRNSDLLFVGDHA
jgi:GGDEF domain-containing protein